VPAYIGSHTSVELLNARYEVIIVDNFLNNKQEALTRVKEIKGKNFIFYEVDLLDQQGLEKVVS
jgi:UDP-glucose 4-epimerase